MRISKTASFTRVLAMLGTLLAATAAYPQAQNAGRNLNVMAVNVDNHKIYSINFTPPGGSTTVGNTDENNYVRPEALAFVTNASTQQLDLLVGDNQRGTIYRYPGALAPQTPPNPTTATLVWNAQTSGTGPAAPNALAVDGYGNLFVTNSTSGHSQNPQLWMFPVGATGSGSFGNPQLLDSSFENKETLLELTLAPTDVAGAPGVSGGDLIVLTTSRVLAYSQASGYTARITLLSFPNCSPVPGGMDFWPIGNGAGANYSLLISSSGASVINRYYFTNPLTAAPAPFYSGLNSPYRLKTLFQQGTPLLFVSQNGSILELGANASGNGTLLATVTQNVTVPQGLAVSNSFTNAASVCLQAGGCNLTGLLDHALTGVANLAGNIVENVCTVNADPRVSTAGGIWSCSVPYTPPANLNFTCPAGTPPNGPGCLPVNAVCPGFDDTGKMALPDTLCGRSGSSGAGFSLIKTLIIPNQFAGAYIQNSAVLADGSNPACGANTPAVPDAADGAFLWAPLLAEGTVLESPNMLDIISGCGSVHGGSDGISVWGVGVSVNEAAPELNPAGGLLRPLENFAQAKFASLATTIDNLTQSDPNHPRWTDNYPNVAASVSLELWGGNVPPNMPPADNEDPFGCLDQSWLDFYNATKVDTDGSAQWIADLQNAANLLTSADASGNTTCDGIVTYAEANNASAFVQTPNNNYPNAPTVLNPYGQLRSRAANLYYSINTRILGNAASANWPLPISINVLPTSVTLASTSSPGSATLSWNTNGASGCLLTSSDGQYQGVALSSPQPLTIPPGDAGTIVTYTVSCSNSPAASTVYAYVNVYPPPTLTLSQSAIMQNGAATLTWNTNHGQGCTTTTSDSTSAAAFTGPSGSIAVSPPASATPYTYTLSCASPNVTVTQTLNVVAPPAVSVTATVVSPPTILLGSGATLNWNANGSTGCSWISNDPALSNVPAGSSPTAVNPTSANTYTYTLSCTTPLQTSSQPVTLKVIQPPALSVSAPAIVLGGGATLTWNANGSSGCSWISNDPALSNMPAGSSPTAVNPTSANTYTYTLSCTTPIQTASQQVSLRVMQPPTLSVSASAIVLGSGATLMWNANGSTGCSWISNDPALGNMPAGSSPTAVNPATANNYTYTLSCTTPVAIASQPVSLTVVQQPTLTISAASVIQGFSATLTWNDYTNSPCTLTSSPADSSLTVASPLPGSGSTTVTPTSAQTFTYTLSCPAPTAAVSKTLTVNLPQPPSINVSPTPITLGSPSTLTWTINPGDVCTASSTGTDTNKADTFTGPIAASSFINLMPNAVGSDTYSLNCTLPKVTESATLTVNAPLAQVSISIKPVYDLDTGDPGILKWTLSTYATGCVVSGTWPKYAAPQFSPFPVASTGSTRVTWNTAGVYTYSMQCTNPAAPVETSVTITNDR
jgi:hypothetical protein